VATDQDGATGVARPSVVVANASPVGESLEIDATSIDEGDVVTLTGSFSDVGSLDSHAVLIDWGDGQQEEIAASLSTGFSQAHQYVDGESPTVTIEVSLFDDDAGTYDFSPLALSVHNVAPIITEFNVPAQAHDAETMTLTAQAFDPGDDLIFNWLMVDPQMQSTTFTAESVSFVPQLRGTYTISLLVVDGDGGVDQRSANIHVVNSPPTIDEIAVPTLASEGESVTVSALATDLDLPVSYHWSVNLDGQSVATAGEHSLVFVPGDDGEYEVQLTVTDGVGASRTEIYDLTVENVSPSIDEFAVPALSLIDSEIQLSAEISDAAGASDPLAIQWVVDGPGADNDFLSSESSFAFSPVSGGFYDVNLSVDDGDGGISSMAQTIWVSSPQDNVNVVDGTVFVTGSEAPDSFHFAWREGLFSLGVNGSEFFFQPDDANAFSFDGGGGGDIGVAVGSPYEDVAEMGPTWAALEGDGYSLELFGVDTIQIDGSDGQDVVTMYDSEGDDKFTAAPGEASFVGDGYESQAVQFENVRAISSLGDDRAVLNDTDGNDTFRGTPEHGILFTSNYTVVAESFTRVYARASNGDDRAYLYDSEGNDNFLGRPEFGRLGGATFYNHASNFDRVSAFASNGGLDRAFMFDSIHADHFTVTPTFGRLSGDEFYNYVAGFERVYGHADAGGLDRAYFYDSEGDDSLLVESDFGRLIGDNFFSYASEFERQYVYTSGGLDTAMLRDSEGDDSLTVRPSESRLSGAGLLRIAVGFDDVSVVSAGLGDDVAVVYDSPGDDFLRVLPEGITLQGDFFENAVNGFDEITAISSSGGNDTSEEQAVDYVFSKIGNWNTVPI
jgi:hypothetical protein